MDEISPKLQNQIAQFQQLQQQLQTVMGQKIRMDAMLKEMEMTIEELKKTPQDATVYRNVGSLMIKVADIPALLKELEEDKETTEVRIKSLDRQEKMLKEKFQNVQEQLSRAIGAQGAPLRMDAEDV
ncbi:MAG TPA: prefoldin subunit beta [Methanomassiliicoccales archaeon]|jgi:prefoldin beta subunit|nr:prefoldin subunit beta [Euryarchaeota archaeon]HOE52805.1 prefoldin subunit beta [Methanomassiliicoccales archaeon]HOO03828.1 prefoldin subunit beta [Methanomassiliicoccales archaeon]HQM66265.1 prefoldin subunit beta [Methanomassiliicoccales archaeon]HRR66952.1 prefoldin subunit beta [Methanomassiliicoccales archaeon]